MLRINNLSLSYENGDLLFSEADFQISSGLWLLEGFNGCGKSTLLHAIMSDPEQRGNHWRIDDDSVIEKPSKTILIDAHTTIPNVKEKDCAEFIFKMNGLTVSDYTPIYNNRKLNTYSTGEKKAAIFHIISYLEPELVLIDEFISNLDDDNLTAVFDQLQNMVDRGTIVLVASNENDIKDRFVNRCQIRNQKIVGAEARQADDF